MPADFVVTDWQALEPFFKELLDRDINTAADLEQWLKDQSELEAVVNEDACWRQIKMTCDTENKVLEECVVVLPPWSIASTSTANCCPVLLFGKVV